ncbi:hypothetical protein [Sphingobacterium lactis]|uniref:hypothetical protein n=1 Tax=Sphingobacterium lactis TaxID=797291 RepID=UPI003DA4C025
MKPIFNKTIPFAFVLFVSSIFIACNKENGDSSSGSTQLVVELAGITDGPDNNASAEINPIRSNRIKASASGSRSGTSNGIAIGQLALGQGDDLSYISGSKTVGYNSPATAESVFDEQPRELKSAVKNAATTPMGTDIKYRVLFFKGTDTTPFAIVDGAAGVNRNTVDITPGKIPGVNTGTNIRWVAYSYNSKNALPPYTTTTATNNAVLMNPVSSTMPDLLYKSGTLVATLGENRINLTLSRVMAKMRISINLSGTGRTIESATANIAAGSRNQGYFNLNTGKFERVTNATSGLNLQVTSTSTDKKIITFTDFYTVPTGYNAIYFNLTTLTVKGTSGIIQTNQNPKTYTFDPLNKQPKAGRTLLTEIAFTESPLVRFGLEYSRGYLYYDKHATTYKYNMLESEAVISDYTTPEGMLKYYFRNRKLLPVPEGTNDPEGDPCQKVYPLNFWMTPISLRAPFANGEPVQVGPYPTNNGDLGANTMTGAGGKRYWYLAARDESEIPADPGLYSYPEVRLLALGYRASHTATAPSDFKSPSDSPAAPAGLYLLGRNVAMQYKILKTGWNGDAYFNWTSLNTRNTPYSTQGFPLRCSRNYDFPAAPQSPFNWPN